MACEQISVTKFFLLNRSPSLPMSTIPYPYMKENKLATHPLKTIGEPAPLPSWNRRMPFTITCAYPSFLSMDALLHTWITLLTISSKSSLADNDDHIMVRFNARSQVAHDLLQHSPHPVAYHRLADLLADRYAKAEMLHFIIF